MTVYLDDRILTGKLLEHVGGSDGYYLIARPSIVVDERQLFVVNVNAVRNIVIDDMTT